MSDIYNSKIARIIGWLNGCKGNWAVTISSTCTLYSCEEAKVHTVWRLHENCHKRQIRDEGWLKFMIKYLIWNTTKGYHNNPYEIEARLAAIMKQGD